MSKIIQNASLLEYNTFGLPSTASHFKPISHVQDLRDSRQFLKEKPMPYLPLGGGSNILFVHDFPGLVLYNQIKGYTVVDETVHYSYLEVGGGENWHDTVLKSMTLGLQGMENLSLIPGSTGAAPVQNIGAYGVELKDIFYKLDAFHLETGEERSFMIEECDFGYRHSFFKTEEGKKWFIMRVVFRLSKLSHAIYNTSYGAIDQELEQRGNPDLTPQLLSDIVCSIRRSKLPDPTVLGNCGSFFKNPIVSLTEFTRLKKKLPDIPSYPVDEQFVKLPAGWLIERAGLKGIAFGQVGTYQKQALVLVNLGRATGDDALQAAQMIQEQVYAKTGVSIEPEVTIL